MSKNVTKPVAPVTPVSAAIAEQVGTLVSACADEAKATMKVEDARAALCTTLAAEIGVQWFDADKKSEMGKKVEPVRVLFLEQTIAKLVQSYKRLNRYSAEPGENGAPSERFTKARASAHAYWGKVKDKAAEMAETERKKQDNGPRPAAAKSAETAKDEATKAQAELPLHVRLFEQVKRLESEARTGGLTEAADFLKSACEVLQLKAAAEVKARGTGEAAPV